MTTPAKHDDETAGPLERWRVAEPVRLWLYGTAVPLLALLVGYGVVSDHLAALWLAAVQGLLVVGGTEAARQWTVSPRTARRAVYEAAASTSVTAAPDYAARTALVAHGIPQS